MLFKATYYLGEHYVATREGRVFFGIRNVNSGSGVGCDLLAGSDTQTNTYEDGVRPVVYLKTDLQLKQGDEINHWTMVK